MLLGKDSPRPKNKQGEDSPFPKFLHHKIRRRNGVESLTILQEGSSSWPLTAALIRSSKATNKLQIIIQVKQCIMGLFWI